MLRTHTEDICRPGRSPGHPPPRVLKHAGGVSWAQKVCPASAKWDLYVLESRVCWLYVLGICPALTSWVPITHIVPQDIYPGLGRVSWGTCPLLFVFPRTGGGGPQDRGVSWGYVLGTSEFTDVGQILQGDKEGLLFEMVFP